MQRQGALEIPVSLLTWLGMVLDGLNHCGGRFTAPDAPGGGGGAQHLGWRGRKGEGESGRGKGPCLNSRPRRG